MNKYRLNIDGKEVMQFPGQTILHVCKRTNNLILLFAMMKEQKFTVHVDFVW